MTGGKVVVIKESRKKGINVFVISSLCVDEQSNDWVVHTKDVSFTQPNQTVQEQTKKKKPRKKNRVLFLGVCCKVHKNQGPNHQQISLRKHGIVEGSEHLSMPISQYNAGQKRCVITSILSQMRNWKDLSLEFTQKKKGGRKYSKDNKLQFTVEKHSRNSGNNNDNLKKKKHHKDNGS